MIIAPSYRPRPGDHTDTEVRRPEHDEHQHDDRQHRNGDVPQHGDPVGLGEPADSEQVDPGEHGTAT